MSGFLPFVSPSQARNPQRTYEFVSFGSDGTQLTSSGTTHTIGTYTSLGTTSGNLAGIRLGLGITSGSGVRYQFNLRAGGTTIIIPDYHLQQITTTSWVNITIPLIIASGTSLDAAIRASTGSSTIRCTLTGIVDNTLDSPGFSTMTGLNQGSSTQAGSQTVTNNNTYVELVASTSTDINALMCVVAADGSAPTTGQRLVLSLATGTAGNEVEFFREDVAAFTTQPYINGGNLPCIQAHIAAGSRLSAKINSPTTNADTFRVGLWSLT